jgi:hypothetical protein
LIKEVPGDIAYGKKPAAAVPGDDAPVPGANPAPVGFPPFIQPAPPTPAAGPDVPVTTTTVPPPACRTADPVAPPKHVATNNIANPPAVAKLPFRNQGNWKITDPTLISDEGNFPATSTRVVTSTTQPDGTFEFVVTEAYDFRQTATTYYVDPTRGLYLRRITTTDGVSTDDFVTDRPDALLLLPLPVASGAPVGGAAVDVRSGASLSFVGTVTGKAKVDACGTPLDAWEVNITEGRITGPDQQQSFTAVYDIGTQFGGLSLRDEVSFKCDVNPYCDLGREYTSHNVAVVSTEPSVVNAA